MKIKVFKESSEHRIQITEGVVIWNKMINILHVIRFEKETLDGTHFVPAGDPRISKLATTYVPTIRFETLDGIHEWVYADKKTRDLDYNKLLNTEI